MVRPLEEVSVVVVVFVSVADVVSVSDGADFVVATVVPEIVGVDVGGCFVLALWKDLFLPLV